ncbi:MAG: hypothetical protein LKE53_01420 [Oscillospiraceae bacterium]|jgi:cell division protein FtsW (lipid II flippase)|nr:hypothetical protein [Oscillospiraceae bacterium]MDD3260777.1 hypothetical protein [Oscillospiraceae bacterium]
MNAIKEFLLAALPWIAIGISVILVFSSREQFQAEENTQKDDAASSHALSSGVGTGLCLGTVVGVALMQKYGTAALSYGICFGVLLGTLAGTFLQKHRK